MNLEEKVNQSYRTISMHYAPFDERKHTSDVVQDSSALECAERKLCASPEIKRTNLDTLDSERENSGFSV